MGKVKLSDAILQLYNIFPITEIEVKEFEKNVSMRELPSNWKSPFDNLKNDLVEKSINLTKSLNCSEAEKYKMAARDGKELSQDILDKLNFDREQAEKDYE